jgi:hypothetical protein
MSFCWARVCGVIGAGLRGCSRNMWLFSQIEV